MVVSRRLLTNSTSSGESLLKVSKCWTWEPFWTHYIISALPLCPSKLVWCNFLLIKSFDGILLTSTSSCFVYHTKLSYNLGFVNPIFIQSSTLDINICHVDIPTIEIWIKKNSLWFAQRLKSLDKFGNIH
jgi:hypothetical protein